MDEDNDSNKLVEWRGDFFDSGIRKRRLIYRKPRTRGVLEKQFSFSDTQSLEKEKERIHRELREIMRELAVALATGNFDKVRRLKSSLEGLFKEAKELGISIADIQDFIKTIENIEAKQIGEQVLAHLIENDLEWFKSFNAAAYKLSEDIDAFITPKIVEQLADYNARLDRGDDLTEEEAREFVDTHLSPPRFDENIRLVKEQSRLVDEHFERRNALIKVHGESHDVVRSFDEKTKEDVKRLSSNNQRLKRHIYAVRDVTKRSDEVRKEMERRVGQEFKEHESVIEAMRAKLDEKEKKIESHEVKEVGVDVQLASTIASRLIKEKEDKKTEKHLLEAEKLREVPLAEKKLSAQKDLILKSLKIGEQVREFSKIKLDVPQKPRKKFVNRFSKKKDGRSRS